MPGAQSLEELLKNPINNSTSKQQYSFSKCARFRQNIKTEGPDTFYEIPSTKSKISFSFKDLVIKKPSLLQRQSPEPASYRIQGDFEKILKKKYGNHILYGRDDCKGENLFQKNSNPGPGSYQPKAEIGMHKIIKQFTFRQQTQPQKSKSKEKKNNETPGPGSYKIKSMILDENKILSTENRGGIATIFPEIIKKRMKTQNFSPLRNPQVTNKGDKLGKARAFSIGKSRRFKEVTSKVPSPGSYKVFTEFLQK